MDASKNGKTGLMRACLLGAAVFAGVAGASSPAAAQYWGGWFGGGPAYPAYYGGRSAYPAYIERETIIPPRIVASILRGQGFVLTNPPARRGNVIVAVGVDERGYLARFVLDAHDGAVIRTTAVGGLRPPGLPPRNETFAYGVPGGFGAPALEPAPVAPRAKPKPKVKTAIKQPAPLPQAAPASPVQPPSEATRNPAPAAPVQPAAITPVQPATPPVASRSPVTPTTPEVRPAPDAQPLDVGPKVVPVKPVEARAPEPKAPEPAEWDTEAAPKVVTPAEANTMAPERHSDQ